MVIVMKDIEEQFRAAIESKLAEVLVTADVVKTLVGELLTAQPEKSSYGSQEEPLVRRVLREAVKKAVHVAVDQFVEQKQAEIQAEVNRLMLDYLKPTEIANTVVGELTQVRVSVIPFPPSKGKKMPSLDADDE